MMDGTYKKSLSGFLGRYPDRSLPSRSDTSSSDISSLSPAVEERGRLGLTTIYEPPHSTAVVADFIFIHGLGGSSRKTWSHSEDLGSYWPQSWLSADPDFADVRIHVFGYSADWKERQQSALNISDFAQSLVAELKNDPGIRRDTSPITLVGHSMGGCVAKKAYIMAHQDSSCKDLVSRIHSMVFLGTPHRGSDLAPILENILTLAWGKKPFVNDLSPGSAALADINDVFRHFASSLRLWSFYETKPVKTRFLNKIIVEKLSSTLGYPNEEIAAMNCDHRHLCKFESRSDPNYRLLRNSLHTLVDSIRQAKRMGGDENPELEVQDGLGSGTSVEVSSRLMAFLGIADTSEDDLAMLQVLKEPGSCEWFTEKTCFASWEQGSGPQILWMTGRPAAGKSIVSSHVVDYSKMTGNLCSYFFFKHGKNGKATLADCFLSIAHQMAMQDNILMHEMLRILGDQTAWDRADEAVIWRKLFIGCIFKADLSHHRWVIDGIDECANFNSLFSKRLLNTMPNMLQIFATSRDLEEVGRGLATLGSKVSKHVLSEADTLQDMRLYLSAKLTELDRFEDSEGLQAMCDRILQKSRGSFLWLRLVLKEFESAWTDEDMETALEDVPSDLYDVYHRILQSIEADPRKMKLAKSILTWIVLASRPLSIEELRCAIKLDVNQTLQNLVKSIPSLCGQLVFVDQTNKVQIIHETARQFLMDPDLDSGLAIHKSRSHTRLSLLLLSYLTSDALRLQPTKGMQAVRSRGFTSSGSLTTTSPDPALLAYAAQFFSEHIYRSTSEDDDLIEDLCSLLKNHSILHWIEYVSQVGDLGIITRTATNLRGYLERRAKYVSPTDPQVHLVDCWVVDLIRVAAKFRAQLQVCPSAIYCLIPALCPVDSIIARTFPKEAKLSPLIVKNLPQGNWDDCLTRIDYSKGESVAATYGEGLFAVGLSTGSVVLYDPVSIQRIREMTHPEVVRILEFGPNDDLIVSCGTKNLVVWDTRSGSSVLSTVLASPPLAVTFLGVDELLLSSQASQLTKWYVHVLSYATLKHNDIGFGRSIPKQPPTRARFSPAIPGYELLMSVGYRSHPVAIWSPLEMQLLGSCGTGTANGVFDTLFNPNPEIVALVVAYAQGDLCVYNYTTMKLDLTRPNVHAIRLSCSQDGRTLVTGNSRGVIQVFEFDLDRAGDIILTPIYRAQAFESGIRSIALSFDGLRFVAIGRRQCQVWEPAALVRTDNELESISEAIPLAQGGSPVSRTPVKDQITTPLLAFNDGLLILAGKSDGDVAVFSSTDGLEIGIAYTHGHGASIVTVVIAESKGIVVSADQSGRVVVAVLRDDYQQASVETSVGTKPMLARIIAQRQLGRAVSRLLVNQVADYLLVSGNDVDELWELPTGRLLTVRETSGSPDASGSAEAPTAPSTAAIRTAIHHPTDTSLFILMFGSLARVFRWSDFTELTPNEGILLQRPVVSDSVHGQPTYHTGHGMVIEHIAPAGKVIRWPQEAFDASSILVGQPCKDSSLEELGPTIMSVLGYPGTSRLHFVDHNLWICSTDVSSSASNLAITMPIHGSRPSRSPSPFSHSTSHLSLNPGSIDSMTPSTRQIAAKHSSSCTRRHFFALSEWRDGRNKLNCVMFTRSLRKGSVHFAFAVGHRIIVVEGGTEFSQIIAPNTATTRSKPTLGKGILQDGSVSPIRNTPSEQHWTVVSGSMHRRASNW
ncbi:hypothetical protein S40293_09406 [Stachybotrys chartarum IBT 40293]|nr:hypothetical protein S40293_09406 [Stachybotrys chartarum IBT 40293]